MIVVSDTSPISNLFLAGYLHILPQTFGSVIIPERVLAELLVLETDFGYDLSMLKNAQWLEIKSVAHPELVTKLRLVLHEGESEAIALAKELSADLLLIDEAEGRAVASAEGLRVIGVLGVLLEAKEQNLFPLVKPVLDDLRTKSKFWVSEKVYQKVLLLANEDKL